MAYTVIKRNRIFYNNLPFPPQLRMVIIGISGSGITKLIFKFLLKQYLDFQTIIFVSPLSKRI